MFHTKPSLSKPPKLIRRIVLQFVFESLIWVTVALFFLVIAWHFALYWLWLVLSVPFLLAGVLCLVEATAFYSLQRWAYYVAKAYLWMRRPVVFHSYSNYQEFYVALGSAADTEGIWTDLTCTKPLAIHPLTQLLIIVWTRPHCSGLFVCQQLDL